MLLRKLSFLTAWKYSSNKLLRKFIKGFQNTKYVRFILDSLKLGQMIACAYLSKEFLLKYGFFQET